MNVRPGDGSPTQYQPEKFLEEWNMGKSWRLSPYKDQEERNSSQLYSEREKPRGYQGLTLPFLLVAVSGGPAPTLTHE